MIHAKLPEKILENIQFFNNYDHSSRKKQIKEQTNNNGSMLIGGE